VWNSAEYATFQKELYLIEEILNLMCNIWIWQLFKAYIMICTVNILLLQIFHLLQTTNWAVFVKYSFIYFTPEFFYKICGCNRCSLSDLKLRILLLFKIKKHYCNILSTFIYLSHGRIHQWKNPNWQPYSFFQLK